ncbi:hypothetical protein FBU30_003798 [Linnemannia zychae]|nr:hypothetical protein FBU30_003798 [Linnemannia zychae]
MFDKDSRYQSVIDGFNKVQIHGGIGHKLNIPQMAIIGDQSSNVPVFKKQICSNKRKSCIVSNLALFPSFIWVVYIRIHYKGGKSSVLEALTKLSFPRDKGMCTRFAILVNLRRNISLQDNVLSAKIEGDDAFNGLYNAVNPKEKFEGAIKDAVSKLCGPKDSVSDRVLELTLSGPDLSPLTVIDLPGFIHTTLDTQDAGLPKLIESINARYIKEPRTIILAVVQASIDLHMSNALKQAKLYDPEGDRTVPIITKPDRIENGNDVDWVDVVLNKVKKMKHGFLMMRNSANDKMNQSWEEARQEEAKFFETGVWSSVPADRKGREAVRDFLGKLLYEHVSKELPALRREIDGTLDRCKKQLVAFGTPIADTTEAKEKLLEATLTMQPKLIAFLHADYSADYMAMYKSMPISSSNEDDYFVRSSLGRIYEEYRSAMMKECNQIMKSEIKSLIARYKDVELQGFVSFTTFKNIVKGHYLVAWDRVTREYVNRLHKHITRAIMTFITNTADASSRDVFTHIFSRFSLNQSDKIKATIDDIFEDESSPFTLSRSYTENIKKSQGSNTMANQTLESSEISITKKSPTTPPPSTGNSSQTKSSSSDSPPHSPSPSHAGADQNSTSSSPGSPQPSLTNGASPSSDNANSTRSATSVVDASQLNIGWNDTHAAEEMFPCLIAYLKTARDRIVDKVIMETIERHMITRIGGYFQMLRKATEEELRFMLESSALKRERTELETKIDDFEKILLELSK